MVNQPSRSNAAGEDIFLRERRGDPVSLPIAALVKAECKLLSDDEIVDLATSGVVLVINNYVYDVTSFVSEHPGGELVLRNMSGKDCTDAFENFHQANVQAMLPKYRIGRVAEKQVPSHVQAFRDIRKQLIEKGMFKVEENYYVKIYTWLASLFVTSLFLTLWCETVIFHMIGAIVMGIFWQQLAGLGHDLGHTAVSRNFYTDHLNASTIACCLSGLSMSWWKNNHNTHHVTCNSIEHDPDIQHMPIFAVSKKVIDKPYWSSYYSRLIQMDSSAKFLVGNQHILFLPVMFFARFNLYAQSLIFLTLTGPKRKNPLFATMELCSMLFFAIWVTAVALQLGSLVESVLWIVLSHGVAGILHIQIVISHWAMHTYKGHAYNDAEDEWYNMQFKTTLNIDCPTWMDWAHIGLQFQIEHHLFPTLPRSSLRYASKLVRAECKRQGIQYNSATFIECVGMTLDALSVVAAKARSGSYVPNILVDILNANG